MTTTLTYRTSSGYITLPAHATARQAALGELLEQLSIDDLREVIATANELMYIHATRK